MRRQLSCLALLSLTGALAGTALAQPAQPLTLEQVMADPDWIGPGVENAWWSWDGRQAYYTLKRDGGNIRDTFAQAVDGGAAARLDGAALAGIDGARQVVDPQRTRMAFVRNGDIFVRDLSSGALTQLTRTDAGESRPQWGSDGALVWRSGNDWFRWTAAGGAAQASLLKAEDDPDKKPKADELRDRQFDMLRTLRDDRARRDAVREQNEQWRRADPSRAAAPAYLGKDVDIVDSALSPDGHWLIAVTQAKDADGGQAGKLPKYVTESGYEEFEEARTRVGHKAPLSQKVWLVDIANAGVRELKYDTLPGIADDPLAALRRQPILARTSISSTARSRPTAAGSSP